MRLSVIITLMIGLLSAAPLRGEEPGVVEETPEQQVARLQAELQAARTRITELEGELEEASNRASVRSG